MTFKRGNLKMGGLLAVPAIAAIAAMLLAGCGGSGDATAAGSSSSSSGYIVKGNDSVTKDEGVTEIETAKYPNGHDTDEVSVTGTNPIKPCALVTAKQANKILGGHVKVAERLQGPTCVYTASGREISLVVEEVPLKSLIKGAHRAKRLTVSGQPAWCLRYEKSSVVTSVGKGRVLQITGACQAGVLFAAAAIPRVPLAS
jgi:hypothetical protein